MPAPRIENVGAFRKGRNVTDEEWVANYMAKVEPLTQRQIEILKQAFRKGAANRREELDVPLAS